MQENGILDIWISLWCTISGSRAGSFLYSFASDVISMESECKDTLVYVNLHIKYNEIKGWGRQREWQEGAKEGVERRKENNDDRQNKWKGLERNMGERRK
jgi:hypothetical protein